jgi:uncharacterized protein YukE
MVMSIEEIYKLYKNYKERNEHMGKLEEMAQDLQYVKNASNRHEAIISELKQELSTWKVNYEVIRQHLNRLGDKCHKFDDLLNSISKSLANIREIVEGQMCDSDQEEEEPTYLNEEQFKELKRAILEKVFNINE